MVFVYPQGSGLHPGFLCRGEIGNGKFLGGGGVLLGLRYFPLYSLRLVSTAWSPERVLEPLIKQGGGCS